jgi:hypothetical protein
MPNIKSKEEIEEYLAEVKQRINKMDSEENPEPSHS